MMQNYSAEEQNALRVMVNVLVIARILPDGGTSFSDINRAHKLDRQGLAVLINKLAADFPVFTPEEDEHQRFAATTTLFDRKATEADLREAALRLFGSRWQDPTN